MLLVILLLGAFHGGFVGLYACLNRETPEWRQGVASMLKIPALFLLTLAVTGPSLYVFNALARSPLPFGTVIRLLVGGVAVAVAVLASFGTVIGFFSVTTSGYPFMVLLNVGVCGLAGAIGVRFLLGMLSDAVNQVTRQAPPEIPDLSEASAEEFARVNAWFRARAEGNASMVSAVFRIWAAVFAVVGMQMAWVLRPFIGNPNQDFQWFRPRAGNFFESVAGTVQTLIQSMSGS
jgi:hypothetical protein